VGTDLRRCDEARHPGAGRDPRRRMRFSPYRL